MTATLQRPVAAGRAGTRLPDPDPDRPDDLVVFAIRSIALFPAARDLAWRLGAEIFQDDAARLAASAVLTGAAPADPGPRLRARVRRLVDEALSATVPPPGDPAWGLHLLRTLAEREHRPLLVGTLRWAARGAEDGLPLRYLQRRVHEAFAVAEGRRPVDAALLRGGRREWRP